MDIPRHVAVIMDGNGRWAQQQQQKRIFGHQHAITAVRETVEAAVEAGVSVLTLYTFSTENWNRPQSEIDGLMELLSKATISELPTLQKNNINLRVIGDLSRLPRKTYSKLMECIDQTADGKTMTLVLALSYSSRWELTEAMKGIAAKVKSGDMDPESITEDVVSNHLATAGWPDPDLLIRTSGEMRISNFMLWQMAYTEFYFTDVLWPDFRKAHFRDAILAYQSRQRRYGGVVGQTSDIEKV